MAMAEQVPSPATPADDPRWTALRARDPAFDGTFVYSVATTGVYCRPSCKARPARPENVRFHATPADARAEGFRPCLRCRPDGPSPREEREALVARACRLIEDAEEAPALVDLARSLGLSPFHLHRQFKAVTGVTPRAYAAALRADRVRAQLGRGASVTSAIYDAGYGSNSRFYEHATGLLGMTPSAFRSKGRGEDIRFAVGQCSLGAVLVAATGRGVCAIEFGDDAEQLVRGLQDRFREARLIGGDAEFEALVAQVVGLVEEPATPASLPLDLRGTAFQQRVWQALRTIPPGTTTTYTALAERLGLPRAVRAVAGACAANRVAVAIPCHRVVRLDGDLAGYRWGIDRKRALLRREAGTRD
jgi:AraC family transcriptional regulator of adaptative response/methylated-DNA-[protein]-cysteine methyltransferase